jgi:hypothetical protein
VYGFKRAVEVFAQGLGEALTYLDFPGVHQRHIKSTNVLERLIRESGHGGDAEGHGGLGFPALWTWACFGPRKRNPQKSRLDRKVFRFNQRCLQLA